MHATLTLRPHPLKSRELWKDRAVAAESEAHNVMYIVEGTAVISGLITKSSPLNPQFISQI